ncbi:MAG TPA: hypothetical protein VK466_01305 [Terriglobales bacterium]|nr:hypothetical protein [Terriglobales bacterium]
MRLLQLWPLAVSSLALSQTVTPLSSNTNENLRGLSVVSAKVMWASGTHGTYLRSLDGGDTWNVAQVPGAESLDFRDVEAFSGDQAYLLAAGPGEQSRIYKTDDAGKTWALQFTNHEPQGFYDCMAFWDPTHGIALGDPIDGMFELLVTDDGGAHWASPSTAFGPRSLASEGAFAASGSCIATQGDNDAWFVTGGGSARVFHSTNRGQTWSAADTPVMHDGASAGIFSIALGASGFAIAAGGDYQHPEQEGVKLAFTEDGGMTWRASPLIPQSYFSAVALGRDRRVLALGSAHAGFADDIHDQKWNAFWDVNLNAGAFATPNLAFAVGPKGAIVRFTLP